MKLILTDLDETVFHSSDVLQWYLEDQHGLIAESRLRDNHNIPKMFGISLEQTLALIANFHRSKYMRTMQPLPCAAVVLPELHRQGYQFIGITACLNEPEVVEARQRNLTEAFGFEWQAVHCLGLTHCKKAALQAYPASIWVDDLAHHAVAGADVGHRSFLLDKGYNQGSEHPNVTRVADWHHLVEHL